MTNSNHGSGGTGGTGGPEATGESPRREGEPLSRDNGDSLAAGDDSVERAIGRDGGGKGAGTGSAAARSGARSTEGGSPEPAGTDPGDPGGMGGTRSRAAPHDRRPPGGVSPVENERREKQET